MLAASASISIQHSAASSATTAHHQKLAPQGGDQTALTNYTSYRQAFRLTHNGKDISDKEVDTSEARKGIMGWVRLHPANIAARVQIVVEHFRQNVAHPLGGQAKAMVGADAPALAARHEAGQGATIQGTA